MLLRVASGAENSVDVTQVLADRKPHRVPEAGSPSPAMLPQKACGPGTRSRSTNLTVPPGWPGLLRGRHNSPSAWHPPRSHRHSSSVLREGPPSSWALIRLTGPQRIGADAGQRASPSWELLGEAHCTFPHERQAQDSGLLGYRVAHLPNLPEEPECSSEGLTQTPDVERPN